MKSFDIKTKIYFGDNAIGRLKEIPYKRVLIITDKFFSGNELLRLVTQPLAETGKEYRVFNDVVPDPPVEKIVGGVKVVLDYKPDCLIAIGGGSVIDSAKAIREFSVKMDESEKIALIAIPTTSGTGSEVTAFSVITDSVHHIKYPLVSESMLPEEAILDEEFVKSVPPNVTAETTTNFLPPWRKRQSRYAAHFCFEPISTATIGMRAARCMLHPVWLVWLSIRRRSV